MTEERERSFQIVAKKIYGDIQGCIESSSTFLKKIIFDYYHWIPEWLDPQRYLIYVLFWKWNFCTQKNLFSWKLTKFENFFLRSRFTSLYNIEKEVSLFEFSREKLAYNNT